VLTAHYRGQMFMVTGLLPGRPISAEDSRSSGQWLPQASDFLVQLALRTRNAAGSWVEVLNHKAGQLGLEIAGTLKATSTDVSWAGKLDTLRDFVNAKAPASPGFTCCTHGDFWHGNLLISTRKKISGVFDWERSDINSVPLLDLLYLLATYLEVERKLPMWAGYTELIAQLQRSSFCSKLVQQYLKALGISPAVIFPAVVVAFLHRARIDTCDSDNFHAASRMERIDGALDELCALLQSDFVFFDQ